MANEEHEAAKNMLRRLIESEERMSAGTSINAEQLPPEPTGLRAWFRRRRPGHAMYPYSMTLYFSREVASVLEQRAKARGLTVSEWLRLAAERQIQADVALDRLRQALDDDGVEQIVASSLDFKSPGPDRPIC